LIKSKYIKTKIMIHIISFLVKIIMTVVFVLTCGVGLIALSIVFWDERYMHTGEIVMNEYIWGGNRK